ncbi:hypothetical protein BH11PLA2_BH11PLA2_23050 [soil metagenome]
MNESYPNQDDMGDPLLKFIIDHGGEIWFSDKGEALEEELANHYRLSQDLRRQTSEKVNAKGRRVWRNHIQYARAKLVNRGYVDSSVRDLWRETDSGYRKVGLTPPTV